ncbi:MAG: V4R domain-containing protein [Candidatus Njordarchaeum guaymaensis]
MRTHLPIYLDRVIFEKDREVSGFLFRAENRIGVISQVADLFYEENLRIIHMTLSPVHQKYGWFLVYVDVTECKKTSEEIVEKLKKFDFIQEIKTIKPIKKGLIADSFFFPPTTNNEWVVIFRSSVLDGLFNILRDRLKEAGNRQLYLEGYKVGIDAFDSYVRLLGETDKELLIRFGVEILISNGWGVGEVTEVSFEKAEGTFRVYNLFECQIAKVENKCASQFFRGALAGFCSRLFNRPMKCIETKCIRKGDNYCEFHISPK